MGHDQNSDARSQSENTLHRESWDSLPELAQRVAEVVSSC